MNSSTLGLEVPEALDGAATTAERAAPAVRQGPLAVAVAGAGYIAEYHLEVLRKMGAVEVVGACDPDEGRLTALCGRWQIPYSARSLAELIRQRKPEAVHVLVPPPYHYEVAEQALRAGVHVFVEKPMALSGTECGRLIDLARANRLHLGVNHNALYHPLYRRLLRDLEAKKLGKVEHVVSVNNLPLAQLEAGQHDHWMFREPKNVLFEQAPHPLSQVCGLLGPVRKVTTACSGEQALRTGGRFVGGWQMALTCEGGTADLFLAFGRPFAEALLHVIGQDGSVHLDLLNNVYVLDRKTRRVPPLDNFFRRLRQARQVTRWGLSNFFWYGLSLLRLAGRSDPYYLSMKGAIEAFYAPLLTGGRDDGSAENGRMVIEGLEQASAAAPEKGTGTFSAAEKVPVPFSGAVSFTRRDGDVLVLGGTGFIGRRLLAGLAAAGQPLRLLVRKPALLPEAARDGGANVCVGDVCNPDDVGRAVEGCRAVIHLVAGAPPSWAGFEKLFVEGTRSVAEACLRHGVKQLLFASSICALYLGSRRVTVTEETPTDPYPEKRCDYARAKILCERLLMEMHRERGLPVTIFRPGIVVGAGGPVEHLGVGTWPSPTHCVGWGRGNHGLPFVLVDDVASAFVSGLDKPGLEGKAFNLVGDVRLSAAEYVEALRTETGRDVRLHRRSVLGWKFLESLIWCVKAVARKPDNTALTYRELAYRTQASPFDCAGTKRALGWQPVADREQFIELGIRQALAERGA